MKKYFLLLFAYIIFSLSNSIFPQSSSDGLIIHYPFNNNAEDLSSNQLNGQLHNVQLTEDRFGIPNSAIYFNDAGYVIMGESSLTHVQFPSSISFWYKVGSGEAIRNNTNFTENNYTGILFNGGSGVSVHFGGGIGTTGPNNRRSCSTSNLTFDDNLWHHVVLNMKAYNNVDVFIDGTQYPVTYSGTGPTTIAYNSNPGNLGRTDNSTRNSDPINYSKGSFDEFYLWGRLLNSQEIDSLYNYLPCSDGVLTGDEEGLDCGGSLCDPCPTCFDEIQNGNETGIDCGGDCNPCEILWKKYANSTNIFYTEGNVGIGIDNPDELLTVNGIIKAKEFIATPDGWPDYVFRGDYQLMKLEELESYINKNGHLPGVPTEREVSKQGVGLVETNKMLLEKIEELTLYLLQLKKEIDLLKEAKDANK